MRILTITDDYGPFLQDLYRENTRLAGAAYSAQLQARYDSLFGVSDFYSRGFIGQGHESWDIFINNGPLQLSWLTANGISEQRGVDGPIGKARRLLRRATRRILPSNDSRSPALRSEPPVRDINLEKILLTQVRTLKPDVLLNQSVSLLRGNVLSDVGKHVRLMVGQTASALPEHESYAAYDLMISSLPNFVEHFCDLGIAAELSPLAFEPCVRDLVGPNNINIPVSFVGSVTAAHQSRTDLLERLAEDTDITIWGRIEEKAGRLPILPATSPIWRRHRGHAWGRAMYKVLARSGITVNQHIDLAGDFANNMRLFEATGMGALLVTDWKKNVADLFEPGKEVVCYSNAEECVQLIRYYLAHDNERARIARAGQERTLRDHTYSKRAAQLSALFRQHLDKSARQLG